MMIGVRIVGVIGFGISIALSHFHISILFLCFNFDICLSSAYSEKNN